jgi:hypothetical protein
VARKLHIPKAAQIRGLRKAIANRKTPRQFLPSLKKRLAKLTAVFILASCLLPLASIHAQAPVSIVPTQQTLAPAGTACTGSAQTFTVQNRNQTQHYAYAASTLITNLTMKIQGIDAIGDVYTISDLLATSSSTVGGSQALLGSGYFPTVQVVITCFPAVTGSFELSYAGAQATTNVNVGSYLVSQADKAFALAAPAATSYSVNFFTPPFVNSYGLVTFAYTGAGPTGSTVTVQCQNEVGLGPLFTFNLATTTLVTQSFPVPAGPCSTVSVAYNPGGASASTYNFDYFFISPGTSQNNIYTHIPGTTATVVKAGPGVVHTVVVGTPAAGTISLFDLASASCTGTPATNVVSVITATSTFPAAPEIYDVLFNNGICVKASATMDITISSQ